MKNEPDVIQYINIFWFMRTKYYHEVSSNKSYNDILLPHNVVKMYIHRKMYQKSRPKRWELSFMGVES